ncbi:30S ribosomal protein S16 [candidate division FCPU426 bacterium]|nr:30S ribosomal protein S16 [candidate division FCPU426 bacterium]
MATIIKLIRRGKVHKPFWHIVVTDSRAPKGCIEQLGTYDNLKKPVKLELDAEKAAVWVSRGAQPTVTVRRIFLKQGILKKAAELKGAGLKP